MSRPCQAADKDPRQLGCCQPAASVPIARLTSPPNYHPRRECGRSQFAELPQLWWREKIANQCVSMTTDRICQIGCRCRWLRAEGGSLRRQWQRCWGARGRGSSSWRTRGGGNPLLPVSTVWANANKNCNREGRWGNYADLLTKNPPWKRTMSACFSVPAFRPLGTRTSALMGCSLTVL